MNHVQSLIKTVEKELQSKAIRIDPRATKTDHAVVGFSNATLAYDPGNVRDTVVTQVEQVDIAVTLRAKSLYDDKCLYDMVTRVRECLIGLKLKESDRPMVETSASDIEQTGNFFEQTLFYSFTRPLQFRCRLVTP